MKQWLPPLAIAISFIIASMINVYPLGFFLASYRPMTLVLVLIFWAMYEPRYVGVSIAFLTGLIADLLFDTHLGHQAFCAVIMVFFLRVATIYIRQLNFTSAWLLASLALLLYSGTLWLLQSFGQASLGLLGVKSFLVGVLCFPLVWQLLSWIWRKVNWYVIDYL